MWAARKLVGDKYAADFMVVDVDVVRPFYFDDVSSGDEALEAVSDAEGDHLGEHVLLGCGEKCGLEDEAEGEVLVGLRVAHTIHLRHTAGRRASMDGHRTAYHIPSRQGNPWRPP